MSGLRTAIVIAKQPRPGFVKTRMVPPFTPEQAAGIAAAALRDTLHAVGSVPCTDRLLAFAGAADDWTPAGWRAVAQPDGGLDVRLVAAFDSAAPGPAVLVGMDTPQVRPEQLTAFDPEAFDACLGLAADGGFWAIGFTDPSHARAAITGVPMSTEHTGAAQLDRLRALGLRVQLLDVLTDADTEQSAREIAVLVPGSPFAAAVACAVGSLAPVR